MNRLWPALLVEPRDASQRRMAWRVMRQFCDPDQLTSEFGMHCDWQWQVAQRVVAEDGQAIKLRLAPAAGVGGDAAEQLACECVVLFPPGAEGPRAIGKPPRATACISSQPGCGVGCPFCLTAGLGYRGNLSMEQIVEQVYWAGVVARQRGRRLRNVVFMGMGEPLHNTDNVLGAIDWLLASRGFGLSPRHITVSTAGVPGQMLRLARHAPGVRLALSLHSAFAQQRRELVPRACGDLQRLQQAIAAVNALQPQPVWIEMVLLDQCNDSLEHARELVNFCRGLQVEVNLIPYNAAGAVERFTPSPRDRRESFAKVLRSAGIRTTLRTSLGGSAKAACGQLTTAE